MWGTIILFFALTIGLGFITDLIIKNWKAGFLEKIIIRIGTGILLIPVLGVIFNHLRIPIYWPIFLTLAIITTGLTITLRKNILLEDFKELKKSILSLKIKKTQIYTFFVLILFAITAYMYIQGAFNYPWFENGDPYVYALTTKYISLEKTYEVPYYYAHFAYPYTQGYQIFMAVLHQTNN